MAGALPDDGVHAPHLRGALQHTEGLRKGVALVGRSQGGPENQTHGQKVSGQGCPKAGAQHTAGAILPDVISHCKRTPRPSRASRTSGQPRLVPRDGKGTYCRERGRQRVVGGARETLQSKDLPFLAGQLTRGWPILVSTGWEESGK